MQKVQIAGAGLAFLLTVMLGCEEAAEFEEGADSSRFGSAYMIVTNRTPAEPDEPPVILSDTLSLLVSYSGGCADHEFELESSVSGDTAQIWLHHDDGGDDCEARISDRLQLTVPPSVLEARRVNLLNPNADVPFVLRWDRERWGPFSEGDSV